MTTMYGIPNCDTIKQARSWLLAHGVTYQFHDYKKLGVDPAMLHGWASRLGWEVLLNRNGTTFRALSAAEKVDLDLNKAVALMIANPSMIKRPVLDTGDALIVGFKPEIYTKAGLAA